MKRYFLIVFILLFSFCSAYTILGQEKRIYNDGVIDYVPITATFILTAEDFESTLKEIQYSVDGSPFVKYENPISFTTEGRHIISYRALDRTDNISVEKIYSVVIDATPPKGVVSVEGPSFMRGDYVYITQNTQVILLAEDNLSGVDVVYVQVDEGDYIAYTDALAIPEEGPHTIRTYAVDNVGNKTTEITIKGYVDNAPPGVQIVPKNDFVVVGDQNYTNKMNEYTVSAEDDFSGTRDVLVSLDGGKYFYYIEPFKIQTAGAHTVTAKAVDNLGNESALTELTFFVDVVPPTTTFGTTITE